MTLLISTPEDLMQGLDVLIARDTVLASALQRFGTPPLRRHPSGLRSLARIIIGQQVSTASAAAISLRFEQVFSDLTAEQLAKASDSDYRAAGLSRPKIVTFRNLAVAIKAGLDLEAGADDAERFRRALLAVKGIGPWTADLYELECLGLADSFPAADLALQESLRLLEGGDKRPDAKALIARAELWRPYRAVAARLLWHSYRFLKV